MFKNRYLPANKLSPGILSRVLKFRTCEKDLIVATHVCQHWRSALIGDPSLWTPASIESDLDLRRALTYIERSPDKISVDVTSLRDLDTLKYLTPHIARSRSITIKSTRRSTVYLPDDILGHQAPLLCSITLFGVCLAFESPFPLQNLTKFILYLYNDAGSVSMSALFRFFSNFPLLETVSIFTYGQTAEDVLMDQVIPLESLEELHYGCNMVCQVLPFLRLPRLRALLAHTEQGPGQMQKLVDILPHNRHALLETVTTMKYQLDTSSLTLSLWSEAGGTLILYTGYPTSFYVVYATPYPAAVDWFSPQGCIPFGQIKVLGVEAPVASAIFPIDAFALESLEDLRIDLQDAEDVGRILRLFHPDPETGVPCRSLKTIRCTCKGFPGPLLEPLISLAKERKGVGRRLAHVILRIGRELDPHFLEELREHVERVWIDG